MQFRPQPRRTGGMPRKTRAAAQLVSAWFATSRNRSARTGLQLPSRLRCTGSIVEMLISSTLDDSLAPPGQHVASLLATYEFRAIGKTVMQRSGSITGWLRGSGLNMPIVDMLPPSHQAGPALDRHRLPPCGA